MKTKLSNANFASFLGEAFKVSEARHVCCVVVKIWSQAMNDPSNDLASLLVTPVQRIPRYLMLVKQLIKHTPPTHPDYGNLKSAEEKISTIAIIVDQKVLCDL